MALSRGKQMLILLEFTVFSCEIDLSKILSNEFDTKQASQVMPSGLLLVPCKLVLPVSWSGRRRINRHLHLACPGRRVARNPVVLKSKKGGRALEPTAI